MSKIAGQAIASQMAAEKVRKIELPQQLDALRTALLAGSENDRVIIIVDELDRCHPEYAISFLEATKLIFNQSGFIFCLMVNAEYLENLARHRFGASGDDEKYLDKFIDIRLHLEPKKEMFKAAIFELARELPLNIPYAEQSDFSLEHAADLASKLADHTQVSMRKAKRILFKVEVALRCYADRPLDASLLIYLAFQDEVGDAIPSDFLPRSFLTPEEGISHLNNYESRNHSSLSEENRWHNYRNKLIREKAPELLKLPLDRYGISHKDSSHDWVTAFKYLAPHYIPSHRKILDAIATLVAPNG